MKLSALGFLAAASAKLVKTPFGLTDESCVLEVPHLTTVKELEQGKGVELRLANGTVLTREPCASEHAITYDKYLAYRRGADKQRAISAGPPIWNGWPSHLWFGLGYASFTQPPLKGHILSMNTTWQVPAKPTNQRGNASDPWGGYPPTLSTWIGVQGGAVLQPVMEWNGLVPHDYDLVSWNCCPAGYVVHSEVISGLQENDVMYGEVSQSAADNNVFNITSTLMRGGAPVQSVVLAADMRNVAGWEPQWAEAIAETYFVTDCQQLPCGTKPPMATFSDISLVTTEYPNGIGAIPWSKFYEVENDKNPGAPICSGLATPDANGFNATIAFACQ